MKQPILLSSIHIQQIGPTYQLLGKHAVNSQWIILANLTSPQLHSSPRDLARALNFAIVNDVPDQKPDKAVLQIIGIIVSAIGAWLLTHIGR